MKVLVVDDDPVSLLLAQAVLESLGHEVTTADDSRHAWQLLVDERFDVLVSDREMPGLSGLELCHRLRERSAGEAGEPDYCYVILVTGHDSDAEALEGLLAGADDYLGKPLRAEELRRRLLVAQRVTDLQRRLHRQHEALAELRDAQYELARRDALTLLPNRRALQEHLARLDPDGSGRSRGFSIAVLDVDHFKSYNDSGGHAGGDLALARIGQAMAAEVCATDALYRFGGEEFAHVMATGSSEQARAATERLRSAVRRLGLPHPGRPGELVTVSAGIATHDGTGPGRSADEVLQAADRALYEAKRAGRDRARSAEPVGPVGPVPSQRAPVAGPPTRSSTSR